MTDIEDLLERTLQDERRAVTNSTVTAHRVELAARRVQLQRRLAVGATALVSVAVIAVGTVLADGGSARDGHAPSYDTSASAQPRTS